MSQSDSSILHSHVEYLTEIRPFRHYRNLEALKLAADYIRNALSGMGYVPQSQTWLADGNEYENVIASYLPEKQNRLIIGAHYDVCGNQPGADDNASAVAGLLETARLIALNQPELDFGIDFVGYCLEEPPYFATEQMGSYVHAKSLKAANTAVVGMICYEMIGYFTDEPNSQSIPIPQLQGLYPTVGNFIIVVGLAEQAAFSNQIYASMKEAAKIGVEQLNFPFQSELSDLSDHRSYWEFSYNAVMINDTSFLRNPHYHEITDTIDTLDFEKMGEVVNGVYAAIVQLKA